MSSHILLVFPIILIIVLSALPYIHNGAYVASEALEVAGHTATNSVTSGYDVKLYVVPSKLSDLSPAWIIVYLREDYIEYLILKVFSKIDIDMSLYLEPVVKAGQGPRELKVTVYIDDSPVSNAYVEVVETLTREIIASGFTDNSGSLTFSLPSGEYKVRCYYDENKDGLYEYYGEKTVAIGLINVAISVSLANIMDILNIRDLVPKPVTHEIPFKPLGGGWFITGIPGLPYRRISTTAPQPLPELPLNVVIKGYMNCSITIDNKTYDISLEVNSTEVREKASPLVITYASNSIKTLEIYEETMGLGPRGWSIAEDTPLDVSIIAMDDEGYDGIRELIFEYSVNDRAWINIPIVNDPIMDYLEDITQSFNQMIEQTNDILDVLGVDRPIQETSIPIFIGLARIPGQRPGVYVKFRAKAIDRYNNNFTSPIGLYYVYNKVGKRVLIIDPHVKLWVIKRNYEQLQSTISNSIKLSLPRDYIKEIENLTRISSVLLRSFIAFHNWQYLGERYNITIIWPGGRINDYLESIRPNVIILSNLYLGLNTTEVFNWDLDDVMCNSRSALESILSYVREKHAGLVATHGTLSDWILWRSKEEKIKIGVRGHIGNNIRDMVFDRRLAGALGLIWLPLWEYVRDTIATALCEAGEKSPTIYAVGLAIGSTPLQVPYVPWDGILEITREGKLIGWSIPEEPIVIPNPYMNISEKYKAYTQIGWQLGAPRAIAYTALNYAKNVRGHVVEFYNGVYEIVKNATIIEMGGELSNHLEKALEYRMYDLREALAKAEISMNNIYTKFRSPELRDEIKVNVTIPTDIYDYIMRLVPLKVVALSPNGTAGITVFDLYWDPMNGYRAVYLSFEVEASISNSGKILLQEAVEWASNWEFMNITELLRGMLRVPKDVAETFENIVRDIRGEVLCEKPILLPEEGSFKLTHSFDRPTNITIVIAHPWSDKVNVTVDGNVLILGTVEYNNVTQINVYVEEAGNVTISVTSDPTSTFDQAYLYISTLEVEEEIETITTTTTVTTTETITETTTETITMKETETVTVTSTITTTEIQPKTTTITKTVRTVKTTTITSVITEIQTTTTTTATTIHTIVTTKPITMITTITETKPVITTLTTSIPVTTTVTEWRLPIVISVIILIIGFIIMYKILTRRA